MNEKLRKILEANGLRKDASEQEAWAKYDEMLERGFGFSGIDIGVRSAPVGEPSGGENKPADKDDNTDTGEPSSPGQRSSEPVVTRQDLDDAIGRATARALEAERSRRNAIEEALSVAGLNRHQDDNFARTLLDNPQCSVDEARAAIFKELKKRNTPFGPGAHGVVSVGVEAGEKLRAAISDGLAMRSGVQIDEPAEGYREFRGRSLVEICRELLEASGENCRGLSNMEIAGRALASRALASQSTSDFPHILGGLVNQTLLAAYEQWPQTWRPFVGVTQAQDFKDIHAVKMSEAPDLKGLGENGEYQSAAFSDSKETYNIITKGIKVSLTRQMIINDDLRAFTRIPQLFGASARRMEADAVWGLITGNGKMSDGYALIHGQHNNLGAAGGLVSATLGKARAAMRKQKGMEGVIIDVTPAFLLVPVVMETAADVLLRSAALPEDNKSAGVHNPWAGRLTPISDPHLDAVSESAFYLMAHPNQFPVIEVAYLAGEEQPYVEEMVDFDSDALKIKVRHDFGAGVVDHVGIYKCPGA